MKKLRLISLERKGLPPGIAMKFAEGLHAKVGKQQTTHWSADET